MSNWRQALRRFAREVLDVRDLIDPFGVRPEHRLAEDAIPSDAQGRRDDRAYTRPIEHYRHLYEADTSVDALLDALAAETDDVARTSLLDALGHTRSKRAAAALETVIANPTTDAEHRETAARSLRRIRESR